MCIREIVYRENLQAVFISNEDFFPLTNKLENIMQNDRNLGSSSKGCHSELWILVVPVK